MLLRRHRDERAAAAAQPPVSGRKRGRPKGSRNKPKPAVVEPDPAPVADGAGEVDDD